MADVRLDVYDKVCPLPAALTKKAVIKLAIGQTLEIEGDCDYAIENVIKMCEKHGAVVLQKETQKNFFKVLVKKQSAE